MQLVEGYTGTSTVRLTMDSGEVDGMCGWGWESIKTTADDKTKSADLRVVLQSSLERHPEIKDVPAAMEYAKDEQARKLIEVDAYNHGTLERVFSLPPGVAEQRSNLRRRVLRDLSYKGSRIERLGIQSGGEHWYKRLEEMLIFNPKI